MARKARQRITYVLPLANAPGGHRLGVNGLAIDPDRSILYSGGRDGLLCLWDVNLDLRPSSQQQYQQLDQPSSPTSVSSHGTRRSPPAPVKTNAPAPTTTTTTFSAQVQAHTHWVNDILLAQSNSALISASSDLTVKAWRPHSEEPDHMPQTVGVHTDYVKRLASPGPHSAWVASGGLDHKIRLWDLVRAEEKMQIDVGEEVAGSAKGSVYALCVRGNIMASGGPEGIVRLWDPRTGRKITNFVGHTDNVRDILINQNGDYIMTASSDQSIKVWSTTAGRCMHTLTMHNDSVWSLYSDHPQLEMFYSTDRSGLVAKTDVRHCEDLDDGMSVAVAQEQGGVNKLAVAGEFFWTATPSSSVNRWRDVNTSWEIQPLHGPRHQRVSSNTSTQPAGGNRDSMGPAPAQQSGKRIIPRASLLRISNNAPVLGQRTRDTESVTIRSGISQRRMTEAFAQIDIEPVVPFQDVPVETTEGQNGLIKHVLLSDRRRALTLDTASEVILWDLIKCRPIRSFGKRDIDEVKAQADTVESVANWCSVNTRTGRLAVILEENYCFDAELYADQVELNDLSDFREDQRINLGKWVLRHIFSALVDEEINRDATYRQELANDTLLAGGVRRANAPSPIAMPSSPHQPRTPEKRLSLVTPKANKENVPLTPGQHIGVATPQVNGNVTNGGSPAIGGHIPPTINEDGTQTKRSSFLSQPRTSSERPPDYFSPNPSARSPIDENPFADTHSNLLSSTTSPVDGNEKDEKTGNSIFGKKFRMAFPRKLVGRNSSDLKPAVMDEKSEESDRSEEKENKSVQENFFGTLQEIRFHYQELLQNQPTQALLSGVHPPPANEAPTLAPPVGTTIIIQEEKPDSGGVADLYRGAVTSLGTDADTIEKFAPKWLGDLLLKNELPPKDLAKVSFVLLPYQDLLPSIASADGNTRLTANRMLRAKKVLSYIAERIEAQPAEPDLNAMKPEEYLEVFCQNQLVEHNTTLGTLRAHIWKTGGDVVLYYRSNGKKAALEEAITSRKAALAAAEASGKIGPSVPPQ